MCVKEIAEFQNIQTKLIIVARGIKLGEVDSPLSSRHNKKITSVLKSIIASLYRSV